MTDELTRDHLAEALQAVRADAVATGDMRVQMTELTGSVNTLTTEVRLSLAPVVVKQQEQDEELASQSDRLAAVERGQWKVAGLTLVVGILGGAAGASLLGLAAGT